MKTTLHFDQQVLRKRPYLSKEMCEAVVAAPEHSERQVDGRVRYWGRPPELAGRWLRVVTLSDRETIHNAFPDRHFVAPQQNSP